MVLVTEVNNMADRSRPGSGASGKKWRPVSASSGKKSRPQSSVGATTSQLTVKALRELKLEDTEAELQQSKSLFFIFLFFLQVPSPIKIYR